MTTSRPVRALLVDDHALFRDGLRELLVADGQIEVVAMGGNGAECVELALRHRPDVILLDVEMPGQDAWTTLEQLRRQVPESKVVILSMHEGYTLVQRLLDAGAAAYLTKSVVRRELVAAVCATAADESDSVTVSLPRRALLAPQAAGPESLSAREAEVLDLVAQAYSNAEIAGELFITESTVKRHLSNIYAKLGATSRLDAVRHAMRTGLSGDFGRRPPSA
ncbi:response regulator transcription factor [Streptomyces sp. NPDC001835]|uniref:response regulator transcription factor n=1 Tax=Streptomyces sp. NPDC001835 TaxID=3154528 RepID=UPI0033170A58